MIPIGTRAPTFEGETQFGRFRSSELLGKKNLLLVGYPLDWTPICTSELPELNRRMEQFLKNADTEIVSISCDSVHSHRRWSAADLSNIRFRMFSDSKPHGAVSRMFGMYADENGSTDRATVLIDKNGTVRFAESAGIDNRRDIERLLEIATRANGGPKADAMGDEDLPPAPETTCGGDVCPMPAAPAGKPVKPAGQAGETWQQGQPLDLSRPVLFAMTTCSHCSNVKQWISRQKDFADKVRIIYVDRNDPGRPEYNEYNRTRGRIPSGTPTIAITSPTDGQTRYYQGEQAIATALLNLFRPTRKR